MKSSKIVFACIAASMISGCASIQLNPEAMKVRVTHNEPVDCEFVGDVTGTQGNKFSGAWTSNANLETGARNDLKNKAYNLGGDTVYILTNRAGQTSTGSGNRGFFSSNTQQTNVTFSGSVFKCKK